MRVPLKKVYHCPWCKEVSGLIYPEDLYKAIRMSDGSLKCETCQTEELLSRIVRVTPNSQRAREILAKDQREVSRYNDYAQRLNKSAGIEDGIVDYSYALYSCEYCAGSTFLSLKIHALMVTPKDTAPGAIIVYTDKKTGEETRRRVVGCASCLKQMAYQNRNRRDDGNEDVHLMFMGPDTQDEFDDVMNQRKKSWDYLQISCR